ncbi:MAG: PepSY domain-containing protein [Boseongicola sp.]|nr:PepSY domain-containing protein [Boseongicola sp.]NNJ69215.1 PepSY domain-containing protein [Boseongicola sp.]
MKYTIPLATAFAVWMGAAQADDFSDKIVANLQDLGYGYIEIKNGISQVKVEAIRGTEKLEVVYDRATGQILKREMERADGDDLGQSGVDISTRNRDFLDDDDDDDDDSDDD